MRGPTKRKDANYMKVYDWSRKNKWPSLDTVYYPRNWDEKDKLLYRELLCRREQRRKDNERK